MRRRGSCLADHSIIVYLPAVDRDSERAAIAAFIATRGVTRCATRYVGIVDGAVPEAEIKRRLATMPRPRSLTRAEVARVLGAALAPRPRGK